MAQGTIIEDAMLVFSGSELKKRVFDPVVKSVVSFKSNLKTIRIAIQLTTCGRLNSFTVNWTVSMEGI